LSFLADHDWTTWAGAEQPEPDAREADASWGDLEGAAGEPMADEEQQAIWNTEDCEQAGLLVLE
jgi:hypothetical protein